LEAAESPVLARAVIQAAARGAPAAALRRGHGGVAAGHAAGHATGHAAAAARRYRAGTRGGN